MSTRRAGRRLRGCAAWALGAMCPVALAADVDQVIATDRPAVAESSVVVPRGWIQLESGFLATDTGGHTVLDAPEAYLRFGVLEKTELRLTMPDFYRDLSAAGSTRSGFGDAAIGLKQQLGPVGGFDVSIVPFVTLRTGAEPVSSHGYDPALQVPWSRSLSANWTLGGQLAAYWPTVDGRRNRTGEATLLLDRQLTAPWDTFVEYAGDFPGRGSSIQLLHVGTAYKISPRHQLDAHVAVGLTNGAPRSFAGFGYSILLPSR